MGKVELSGVEGRGKAHAHARKLNDHDLGFKRGGVGCMVGKFENE